MINRFFSDQERSDVLSRLKGFATSQENIVSTVLVGSGVRGFGDQYSDIDILYITEPAHTQAVFKEVESWFKVSFKPLFFTSYQHRDDVFVLCFLQENLLEVDIGLWSTSSLFATRPDWQVIQARSPKDNDNTKALLKENTSLPRPYDPIIRGDDPLWQLVYGHNIAKLRHDASKEQLYTQQLQNKLGNIALEQKLSNKLIKQLLKDTYGEQRSSVIAASLVL